MYPTPPLPLSPPGELQSILCAAFCSADVAVTGTLGGDIYKWKGHTLSSVIKGAHNVRGIHSVDVLVAVLIVYIVQCIMCDLL